MQKTIEWKGQQAFYISGTEHDDTVRVEEAQRNAEDRLVLTLPTLCITYADMRFANDVGGVQEDYPASRAYGPRYFDPPVEIAGGREIEKLTWIKGADRVVIGPEETTVEWRGGRTLVIPRLRIKPRDKVKAVLDVKETTIHESQPFVVQTRQFADGRHTGGVQLVKRHPDWKPEPDKRGYDLWVRAIDGKSGQALVETKVSLYDWNPKEDRFALEAYWYTNSLGVVDVPGLPCSDKKLVIVEPPGRVPRTWRFRPLPGQKVRQVFRLWSRESAVTGYIWQKGDTLENVALMAGSTPSEILELNGLTGAEQRQEVGFEPGQELKLPCFAPIYRVDARDTLERLGELFCYDDLGELAAANELAKPFDLHESQGLKLDGWRFFRAGSDDPFTEFDQRFGVPAGWTRPAQRTLHDNPALAYEGELVAVPTREFAAGHELRTVH
jgi:LysM repeat protein